MDPPFLPNDGLLYRFPSIFGYDPLVLKRYLRFIQRSQGPDFDNDVIGIGDKADPRARLLGLLHIRHLVQGNRLEDIRESVPYARFVPHAITMPDEEAIEYIAGDRYDPMKVVVLDVAHRSLKLDEGPRSGAETWSCRVVDYKNERIMLRASCDRAGYLVVSEIFYPGWRARVDLKDVEVLRGDYLFRVIPLEAGGHEVELYFVSWPFRIGLAVSLATLAGMVAFALKNKRA